MGVGRLARQAPRLAAVTLALATAALLGSAVGEALNGRATGNSGGWGAVPFLLVVLVVPAVGALLVARRPANAVGWLALGASTCVAVALFAHAWAVYALRVSPQDRPGGATAAWFATWLFPLGVGLLPFLVAVFPSGRPASWLRLPLKVGAVVLGLFCVAQAVAPDHLDGVSRSVSPIENPMGVSSLRGAVGLVTGPASMVLLLLSLAALASLVLRAVHSDPAERRALRWLVLCLLLLPVGLVLAVVANSLLGGGAARVVWGTSLLMAIVGSAGALAAGVLVDDLFHLRDYARRLALGAVLSALIVTGFVAVVSLVAALSSASGAVPPAVAAAAVALALGPLRGRLNRAVDRMLYGWRSEPYRVLSDLSARLEGTPTAEAALPAVVDSLATGLRLPYARLDLDTDAESRVTVAVAGVPVADVVRLPLTDGDRRLGELVVGQRSAEEPFAAAELALLRELARSASTAARAVLLTTELRAARERLVRSREDERRRLQRELHDGVGPALAGLGLQLDAAADSVGTDPALTAQLLAAMQTSLRSTAQEVRRIAHDLRPGVLAELGLLEAVRAQAHLLTSNTPVTLELDLSADAEVSAAVEVAVYRIASEALANVVQHARAHRCSLRLCVNGRVELDVTDDGVGLSVDGAASGLGLRSMADRVAELGGTFAMTAEQPCGTHLAVRIPVLP